MYLVEYVWNYGSSNDHAIVRLADRHYSESPRYGGAAQRGSLLVAIDFWPVMIDISHIPAAAGAAAAAASSKMRELSLYLDSINAVRSRKKIRKKAKFQANLLWWFYDGTFLCCFFTSIVVYSFFFLNIYKLGIFLALDAASFSGIIPLGFLGYSIEAIRQERVLQQKTIVPLMGGELGDSSSNVYSGFDASPKDPEILIFIFGKMKKNFINSSGVLTYGVKTLSQRGGRLSCRVYWKQKAIPSSSTSHRVIVLHGNSTTCDSSVPSSLAAWSLNAAVPIAAMTWPSFLESQAQCGKTISPYPLSSFANFRY